MGEWVVCGIGFFSVRRVDMVCTLWNGQGELRLGLENWTRVWESVRSLVIDLLADEIKPAFYRRP